MSIGCTRKTCPFGFVVSYPYSRVRKHILVDKYLGGQAGLRICTYKLGTRELYCTQMAWI